MATVGVKGLSCVSRGCLVSVEILSEHQSQRLLEDLVACGVDEWIDAEVDEAKCGKYVEPFIRQLSLSLSVALNLFTVLYRQQPGYGCRFVVIRTVRLLYE